MNRRHVLLFAAGLILTSLAFPYWAVFMRAPAYPERLLSMHVYAYRYVGDVHEWNTVGRLVGVHVPPPIPEESFIVIPAIIAMLGLFIAATAFWPGWAKVGSFLPWVVLVGLLAWTQYALYLFGHSLDPARPLRYLQPFTPPVIGVLTLGKMTIYHVPWLGSVLFVAGALLATLAAWWPAKSRRRVNGIAMSQATGARVVAH